MDESSRFIVKFIAAGTGAILLLMAAYFYVVEPEAKPMPVPPVDVSEPAADATDPQAEIPEEKDDQSFNDDDVKPIDGQPTMLVDEQAADKQAVNAPPVIEQAAEEPDGLARE